MISLQIDSNEQSHPRANDLLATMAGDDRFSFGGYGELPVDIVFQNGEKSLYVELKEVEDYLQSISTGHLYQQTLAARESRTPLMVLVLGSDSEITAAIKNSALSRKTRLSKNEIIASQTALVRNFEANCLAMGIMVHRWKESPFKRLLSTADKILNGASLMSFRPKPADSERDITALSCLWQGIGPALAKTILEDYDLMLCPKADARKLTCLPGIGKKRAAQLLGRVRLCGMK